MQVTLLPQNRTITFSERMRVSRLLHELELLPGTVMVVRGSVLLTEDDLIHKDDEIEVRSVISGGR